MGKITRITSIDLEGIRGFLAKLDRPLNTDGDIVLLAGANGCGKTSLLDALCLALTNYNKNTKMVSAGKAEGKLTICYKKDDEDKIWENSIPAYNNGKWQWKDEKSLLVQYKDKKFNWPQFLARNTFFHQEEAKRIISDKENDNSISSIFFPQPAYKDKLIHELEGFRSKVGRLKRQETFDEEKLKQDRKECIIQFLQNWNALSGLIGGNIGQLECGLVNNNDNLRDTWQSEFFNFVQRLFGELAVPLEEQVDRSAFASVKKLQQVQEKIVQLAVKKFSSPSDSRRQLWSRIPAEMDTTVIVTREADFAAISEKIAKICHEKDRHNNRKTQLQEWMQLFRGHDGSDLFKVLQTLEEYSNKWNLLPENFPYAALPEGFPDWLGSFQKGWGNQLEELFEKLHAEYNRFAERIAKLTEQENEFGEIAKFSQLVKDNLAGNRYLDISNYIANKSQCTFGQLREYTVQSQTQGETANEIHRIVDAFPRIIKKWLEIEENIEALAREKKSAEQYRFIDKIDFLLEREIKDAGTGRSKQQSVWQKCFETGSTEEIKKLEKMTKEFLQMFRVPDEFLGIEYKQGKGKARENRQLQIGEERGMETFSTGQMTQMAVSFMLALNYSFSDMLPHQIVAFDDITTACDMSQLPRFATLLRKVAYASSGNMRRQVFLASHHEDLSDRLIEFLTPPAGRTLRVIRFLGWDRENGPEIRQEGIEPAKAIDQELCESLKRSFGQKS